MMTENYRPKDISFEVATDETPMPENFGEFEKHEEVLKFLIEARLTTISQAITVNRHMDAFEKKELRDVYSSLLEDDLPKLERKHAQLTSEANEAKKKEKDAGEMVNAAMSQAKILAREVKAGLKSMNLDDIYTFRIPFKNRYYFYTWMDKQLKLCRISDIPEHEKTDLWNAMATNEEFILNHYGEAEEDNNEQAEA